MILPTPEHPSILLTSYLSYWSKAKRKRKRRRTTTEEEQNIKGEERKRGRKVTELAITVAAETKLNNHNFPRNSDSKLRPEHISREQKVILKVNLTHCGSDEIN